jgi:hypothetical protein
LGYIALVSRSRGAGRSHEIGVWGADIAQWIDIAEAGRVMGGKRSVMEYSSDPSRVILYLWWD